MALAACAVSLTLGIALSVAAMPIVVLILAGLAGASAIALAWLRAWLLAGTMVGLVAGLWLGWHDVALASSPASFAEDRPVEVVGQVTRGPDQEAGGGTAPLRGIERTASPAGAGLRSRLRVALRTIERRPAEGQLSLVVLRGEPELAPGDWIEFSARLYLPCGFSNPGLPDARLLARGQGIDWVASVVHASELRRIDGSAGIVDHLRRWAATARRAMAGAIDARLQGAARGFVRTMVLGERTDVPAQVEDGFRAAGATHVLSVSGLHLAVVVALFFHGARWLLSWPPSLSLRLPARAMAAFVSLPACLFYTLLTGEAVATVRSAIMAAMVLGAAIVNRPVSLATGIATAALVQLVACPLVLLDVSFQLSFASVIGLGLFARWLLSDGHGAGTGVYRRVRAHLVRSFSASFAASLVTTPLVAHHFGEITPAAPLGNLVLVPIVELVVLPCGLAGAVLGLAHPWLGAVPLLAAGWASRLALVLAEGFRRLAPIVLVCYPTWAETLLLVGSAAGLLQGVLSRRGRRWPWLAAAALGIVCASAGVAWRQVARRQARDLCITFLDVGQGDATLIEGPGGFVALVDGGGRYDGSFDTGARIVEPVLRARGITALDLVVLSHPHPDHMNGLFRILRRFAIGALWQNGDDGGNPAHAELLSLAAERGVPTPIPTAIARGDLDVEAISPRFDGAIAVPPGLEANDASLVVRVSYGGRQVLLTGDIGDDGEEQLLVGRKQGLALRSDVVKVPHHGSRYASSGRLLDVLRPSLAVVSAGRFNRFGLPNAETLGRYISRGIEMRRTDRDGAVTVIVDRAGGIRVACARDCSAASVPAPP